ncbi:hypothetical protein F4823DRAFT_357935 [Ustulina deusta]|nr:hypothetical protein F4823DRAFT_357935 [Ustulina deusta]
MYIRPTWRLSKAASWESWAVVGAHAQLQLLPSPSPLPPAVVPSLLQVSRLEPPVSPPGLDVESIATSAQTLLLLQAPPTCFGSSACSDRSFSYLRPSRDSIVLPSSLARHCPVRPVLRPHRPTSIVLQLHGRTVQSCPSFVSPNVCGRIPTSESSPTH